MLQNSAFWSYKSMKLKYAEKYKYKKSPDIRGFLPVVPPGLEPGTT